MTATEEIIISFKIKQSKEDILYTVPVLILEDCTMVNGGRSYQGFPHE